jgi:hypothetical protein
MIWVMYAFLGIYFNVKDRLIIDENILITV